MKTNVAACSSIGSYFYPQVGRIYMDMLSMYRATSQMISDAVQSQGLPSRLLNVLFAGALTSNRSDCDQDSQSARTTNH